MAYDEYIKKAILTGKTYDDLPARVKTIINLAEWKAKYVHLVPSELSAFILHLWCCCLLEAPSFFQDNWQVA